MSIANDIRLPISLIQRQATVHLHLYETLHLDGMPLGKLVWDRKTQSDYFQSGHDKLHQLTCLKWSSVDFAREFILGFAVEAGLGGCYER